MQRPCTALFRRRLAPFHLTLTMYFFKPLICALIGGLGVLSDVQTAKAFGWLLIIISLYIYWMRWRY